MATKLTLLQLQNLCKRDPQTYIDEFRQQHQHFLSSLEVFLLKPQESWNDFGSLISFLSQVCPLYKAELKEFPQQLCKLLDSQAEQLEPALRKNIVNALILIRNRNIIDAATLLPIFFKLFRVHDKQMRDLLYRHIVADIKHLNKKSKNNKINKTLQNFMYTMLAGDSIMAAKMSLDVIVDLYNKRIWNDAKTVNVIAQAALSKETKVQATAVRFFLNMSEEGNDEAVAKEKVEDRIADLKAISEGHKGAKITKALKKKMERAKAEIKKLRKQTLEVKPNFSAIQLLYDPQSFAEKLFARLKRCNEKFEFRIMLISLISRLIAAHDLLLLNIYPYLQKYIQPSQEHVTTILANLAQAVHSLVPPEDLQPVITILANKFVNDHSSNPAITVGLNTIREICSRQPLSMNKELLQDLTMYQQHKDKANEEAIKLIEQGVTMAARSLIGLFREVAPDMLRRKDKGRNASTKTVDPLRFGEDRAAEGVADQELLEILDKEKAEAAENEDNLEEQGWEMEEDSDSDSDGEWINVSHSDDDGGKDFINISDDESDEDSKKRPAKRQRPTSDDDEDQNDSKKARKGEAVVETTEVEEEEPKKKIDAGRILTPADFERLDELREQKERQGVKFSKAVLHGEDLDTARKREKQNKAQRLAHAALDPEEARLTSGALKMMKKKAAGGSTNQDKLVNKPYLMVRQKREVREKQLLGQRQKRNLKQKQIEKKKKGKA